MPQEMRDWSPDPDRNGQGAGAVFGEGRTTLGGINDDARNIQAQVTRWRRDAFMIHRVAPNSAGQYFPTVPLLVTTQELESGLSYLIHPTTASVAEQTFRLNATAGTAAKKMLRRIGGVLVQVGAGDLPVGHIYRIVYDPSADGGNGAWLVSPPISDTLALLAGDVGTEHLADDAVTAAKIANDAVGAAALGNNAVRTANILNSQVTEGKLAAALKPTTLPSRGMVLLSADNERIGERAHIFESGRNLSQFTFFCVEFVAYGSDTINDVRLLPSVLYGNGSRIASEDFGRDSVEMQIRFGASNGTDVDRVTIVDNGASIALRSIHGIQTNLIGYPAA